MTLGSLDIVSILSRELPSLGIPASTLAALAGISGGRFSSYLNGVNKVPAQHQILLRETFTSLKKLIAYAAPLPLDFRKVTQLRTSLEAMESGALQIIVYQS